MLTNNEVLGMDSAVLCMDGAMLGMDSAILLINGAMISTSGAVLGIECAMLYNHSLTILVWSLQCAVCRCGSLE